LAGQITQTTWKDNCEQQEYLY